MAGAALPVIELVAVPVDVHDTSGQRPDAPVIHKRDRLIVTVIVGATRIERQVTALQDARAGQMLFVKSDNGEVMSARAGKRP